MRVCGILSLFLGLICLCSVTWAEEDIYFEGSGTATTEFPTDDEDIDSEGSGFNFADGRGKDPVLDVIDADDTEDEVFGDNRIMVNSDEVEEPEEEMDDKLDDNKAVEELGVLTGSTHFIAAVVTGGCIGLLFAVCVIMLLVYRMRKKDEGSYALEYGLDGKKPQGSYDYTKGVDSKEYYA